MTSQSNPRHTNPRTTARHFRACRYWPTPVGIPAQNATIVFEIEIPNFLKLV